VFWFHSWTNGLVGGCEKILVLVSINERTLCRNVSTQIICLPVCMGMECLFWKQICFWKISETVFGLFLWQNLIYPGHANRETSRETNFECFLLKVCFFSWKVGSSEIKVHNYSLLSGLTVLRTLTRRLEEGNTCISLNNNWKWITFFLFASIKGASMIYAK